MSTISSLHTELLLLVFSHLYKVEDLAQCRLVCKSWDNAAERTMFGKTIKVTSEASAFKLYRHLFRNPSNAKLVKHLDFRLEDANLSYNVEQLMDLAITPNICELSGKVNAKRFYDILYKTVSNSSVEYKHLRNIPEPADDKNYSHQIKLKFKDYSSRLSLIVAPPIDQHTTRLLSQLKQFPKLEHLIIGGFICLTDMNSMLRCTSRLKRLSVVSLSDDFTSQRLMSKAEVMAWAPRNVKKETNMHEITFMFDARPDFVEYLLLKYPNVKRFKFNPASVWFPGGDGFGSSGNFDIAILHRLLDALKSIKPKDISLELPENTPMKIASEFADSRPEKITFHIEKGSTTSNLIMHINKN